MLCGKITKKLTLINLNLNLNKMISVISFLRLKNLLKKLCQFKNNRNSRNSNNRLSIILLMIWTSLELNNNKRQILLLNKQNSNKINIKNLFLINKIKIFNSQIIITSILLLQFINSNSNTSSNNRANLIGIINNKGFNKINKWVKWITNNRIKVLIIPSIIYFENIFTGMTWF